MNRNPSHEQILLALDDPKPDNAIALELARCLNSYSRALDQQSQRANGYPNPLRLAAPSNSIEAFALEMFKKELTDIGVRVVLTGDS